MNHRIYVRTTGEDTRAEVRAEKIRRHYPELPLAGVFLVDAYTIVKQLSSEQLENIARMLAHPVIEAYSVDKPLLPETFSWSFEIGFLPGVTDNVGDTAKEGICDLLGEEFGDGEGAFFSQITFVCGSLSPDDAERIAGDFYNPLIEHAGIFSFDAWRKGEYTEYIPEVHLPPPAEVLSVDLETSDDALVELGKKGIMDPAGCRRGPLALDRPSLHAIRDHFRSLDRKPTDVELESIAQTWSEHCKHTIFAAELDEITGGLYTTYIKGATEKIRALKGDDDFCVSVFKDNSGAIVFDGAFLVTDKVETHNSPCALDPFGGAITGIVGVNRDAMGCGIGAKPIVNRYGFCFADPRIERPLYRDRACTDPLLSARRIVDGVVHGVNVGGNCSGIPTPQGFVIFDPRYRGKPLVFVGTVGLLPRYSARRKGHEKRALAGDAIVMAGGRVGRDGIHGATFSSEALSAGSPATAVQIGDPITQKKLSDAIVKEARDRKLYNSITDNGAGGLSCSVAEMAQECGGCDVALEKVPLKYPGLEPWQIWVSESQERMTLSVPQEKVDSLLDLMRRRGVEATVIGRFNDSGKCRVTWHGDEVMNLDLDFLHNGLPQKKLVTTTPPEPVREEPDRWPDSAAEAVTGLLAQPSLASFSFISRQYDHEVQAGTVVKPLAGENEVNTRATVVCPVPGQKRGVVLSQALFPRYGDLDSYAMAACAVDAAVRQVVTAGGSLLHLALLDNICWCSSDDPVRLAQLKSAIKACHDYAVYYGTPFISGKDSMFNDFSGFDAEGKPVKISVPPTILISSIGVIKDVTQAVTMDFKKPGDSVYVIGRTQPGLGASEFLSWWGETARSEPYLGSDVPQVPADAKDLYERYETAVQEGFITSAESVSAGGLAVALARQAMAGGLGVSVDLGAFPEAETLSDWELLFSESASRIVCTVAAENHERFEELFDGLWLVCAGKVQHEEGRFSVCRGSSGLFDIELSVLVDAYHSTFQEF